MRACLDSVDQKKSTLARIEASHCIETDMTRLLFMLSADSAISQPQTEVCRPSPLTGRAQKNRGSFITVISILCACLLLLAAPHVLANQSENARELLPNRPIERELLRGETHAYKITLQAGNYLRLFINPNPQSTKVRSQLLAPGGSSDIGVYYFPTDGGERFVSLIAEASGDYRLEIRADESNAKAEHYEVKIEELRPASERDVIGVAAERIERQGRVLRNDAVTSEPVELRLQAVEKYEAALALWRKSGDQKSELRMLQRLAGQYRYLGEIETALRYYEQAAVVAERVGDRYQEANLIVGLGVIYRKRGEYQKALDSFNQARLLFKTLSKRYGEAIAIYNLGTALKDLGDYQDALSYLQEALPTTSLLGDHSGECLILNSIGQIHRYLGDQQEGIEYHNRALSVARTSDKIDMEAFSLRLLGDANVELGRSQAALDLYERSLKICRTVGKHEFEGDALNGIGDAAHLLGDQQKALNSLHQALRIFRSIGDRAREARALDSLARVNYSLGNFDEARKQIEQALEIKESIRVSVINQQLRETLFTTTQSSFALYIDLLMQLHKRDPAAGHEGAALQANERARARSLLELLSESQADIREGVPEDLLELERSLEQQINAKAAARVGVLSESKGTENQAAYFDKEIAALTAHLREVEVQIRQQSPRYAALTQPQPLTPAGIQLQLDDNTVLLEFGLGEKRSWLWAVTRSSINSYQLPSSKEIESSARKVYELLTARQPRRGETDVQYQVRSNSADAKLQTESEALSQILLGQIAEKLKQEWKGKRLAIVAPGALEYIPFAAFPIPRAGSQQKGANPQSTIRNPQFSVPLITQHEIVNLPSASALAAIRSETLGRKPAESTIAVLADPVFELSDQRVIDAMRKTSSNNVEVPRVRSGGEGEAARGETTVASIQKSDLKRSLRDSYLTDSRGGFSRLPFSREEAEAISSLAPKNSFMRATDFQANRAYATSGALSHYRIVHFATHGLLNSERPELSSLVLSLVDEKGKPQDGFLRMHEIYNLQLPADLVVLSACQTALGKQIKGEGLIGLTRGFMYAGARSVVASLWQVDDLATAQLMKTFYRGILKDGLRPAEALRLAQLEMLRQQRWSSPFFWAPFVIQGEWR